jgi:hypothetical protein
MSGSLYLRRLSTSLFLIVALTAISVLTVAGNSPAPLREGFVADDDLTATLGGVPEWAIVPTEAFPATFPPESPHTGIPAIRPTIPNPLPGEPAYTEADVRAAFARGDIPSRHADLTAESTVIERIEFMTAAEATTLLDDYIGQPPERLLCFVWLTGDFYVSGPPSSGGFTGHSSIMMFDALTGNSLSNWIDLDGR